jgi:hypothetical protein
MNDIFSIVEAFWTGLPSLATAPLTLVGGWLVAYSARFVLKKGLKLLRFDKFSARIGIAEFMRKGDARYTPVELVGVLVYWVILAITFIRISKILDISAVSEFTQLIRVIAPGAIAAAFIVIVGFVIVTFLANFAKTLARNAAVPNAHAISAYIKYIGIGIVIAIALDQIGFGKTILGPMILMLFGAVVFGFALAFGLGCKDIARNATERFLRELREREQCSKGTDLEG